MFDKIKTILKQLLFRRVKGTVRLPIPEDLLNNELKKTFRTSFNKFRQQPNMICETFPDMLEEIIGLNPASDTSKETKTKKREFYRKTLLTRTVFRDCENPGHNPKMKTIMSVIIGYNLDSSKRDRLLKSAGTVLSPIDDLNKAYMFLLHTHDTGVLHEWLEDSKRAKETADEIHIIDFCNAILRTIVKDISKTDLLGGA